MKNCFSKLLAIALCVVCMFCTSSCVIYVDNPEQTASVSENKTEVSATESKTEVSVTDKEYPCTFETVKDLLSAIKKNPYEYSNMEVLVKGTLCKCEEDGNLDAILALVDTREPLPDFNGVELRYQIKNSPSINIRITDDILYSIAEHNDYMQVSGIVKISNGEVYLDNCTYTP